MKKTIVTLFTLLALMLVLSACAGNNNEKDNNGDTNKNDTVEEVTVDLKDADDKVVATATLTEDDKGVTVKLTGEGLSEGSHAFHVHEKGLCEVPDFKSAGDHYNPEDKNHGKEDIDGPHAGDFDNIDVDSNGKVDVEFTTSQISLKDDAENTLFTEDGTSLVIHADADDYESQPAGDAGDRIACGVVKK